MKINVRVIAKSKENKVSFNREKNLFLVKVNVAPEKGRANKKIVELLSRYFKVPKNKIRIILGEKTNNKIINIEC